MTFFEHLAELRKRIINSLYAIGIGAFVGVYIAPKVIHFINEPMQKALVSAGYADKMYYNHPAGAVNLVITLGVYIGLVIASPVVLAVTPVKGLVKLMSPTGAFSIYAGMCVVTFLIVWRWVPETKGRTLEEIERSWSRG